MTNTPDKMLAHLDALKRTHNMLNHEVDELNKSHNPTDIARAGTLKQKKLQVKNEITKLETELAKTV